MLNSVTDDFRQSLKSSLPSTAFPDLTQRYLEEPRGRYVGHDGFLIAPSNTAEVSQIVQLCAAQGIGIVPYGGGTGTFKKPQTPRTGSFR